MLGGVQRGWPVGAAVLLALFAVIMSAALNDVRLRTGATGRSVA
jgi:hypothetical protein